ncbi:MAG: GNAT family N-acetyltransferase [Patescibacteria group bacterium]|nr:GNAT family N-acetyltransferase [Patescibacteria group bacterium]MDE1945433.1 GNAT family N-acetyltransferase [Patescibacteria group bacterium]MDE2058050.1 GNAT family N-acetyltransferase [Patescibacteria group bacterium]
MRRIREEYGADYAHYRFGYCEWLDYEAGDDLAAMYAEGYLPYSGRPDILGRFYMARSARLPLGRFAFTSENRRIAKHFDGAFTARAYPAREAAEPVHTLFLDYFATRHGAVMSAERLASILATPLPLALIEYAKDGALTAAVLEVGDATFGHFWFSAYDLSLVSQSLGLWLIQDGARRAKEAGKDHYYLGTVYGPKALYKTNLEPVEWWGGSAWSDDLAALKALARAEAK